MFITSGICLEDLFMGNEKDYFLKRLFEDIDVGYDETVSYCVGVRL